MGEVCSINFCGFLETNDLSWRYREGARFTTRRYPARSLHKSRHLGQSCWLTAKRAQRQTDTCHDGVPRPLFVLRVGEIKAVDGAAGKIATTVQYYTFSF